MKIDNILASIRAPQSENTKTAAAKPAAAAPAATKTASANDATREKLRSALNEALAPSTKTASETAPAAPAGSPVADVLKLAQEISASESDAAVKEARLLGEAFIDGAVARWNEWEKAAASLPAVVAAPAPASVKQAADQGYQQTRAELEKEAESAYVDGYNSTVVAIHKTASMEFLKAAHYTGRILDTIAAAK